MEREQVDRVLDAIDELVDESLAAGPVDNYNIDRYDKCPHCPRSWHGLPVTEQVAYQFAGPGYDADADSTRVLCQGSTFIGPMQREAPQDHDAFRSVWEDMWAGYINNWVNPFQALSDANMRWWKTILPSSAELVLERDQVTVTVGVSTRIFNWDEVEILHQAETRDITPRHAGPILNNSWTELHVLAETAPALGGTWEPITAPGVTTHPTREDQQ